MNKSKANRLKVIVAILVLILPVIFSIINIKESKGIIISEWNNYYNENNIVFFFNDFSNEDLKLMDSDYKINEKLKSEKNEFDKVLKVIDIGNTLTSYGDVKETNLLSGYKILKQNQNSSKFSSKDIAIVQRDLLSIIGLNVRVGVFRSKNAQVNSNNEYYVLEYWSNEYSKWIMIDFLDKGYFTINNNKLSAIEVLNSNKNELSYVGNTSEKNHKKKINKYLDSYSIPIDNTINREDSNSYVTYVKDEQALEIKFKNKYAPPSIFTKETRLFEKSPFDKEIGSDEKAYIILAKENNDTEEKNGKNHENFIIGGFKDDKIMSSYYINVNDSGYEEVNSYKYINLNKGDTKIELSVDGINTISSIVIKKQK